MKIKSSWMAIGLAMVALSGCGGGGGVDSLVQSNAGGVTRIVAFGDSLSDPGAYALGAIEKGGGRFTVNSTDAKVWTELVARDYGLPLLPNQVVTDAGPQRNANGTSYAEGGARLTPTTASPIETRNGTVPFTAPQALGLKVDLNKITDNPRRPCPTATQLPNRFGIEALDSSSASGIFDVNLAGCILPDSTLPFAATLPPTEDAGIGFFVSNAAGAPEALVAGAPLPTRSGITTLPVTKQVARFLQANPTGNPNTVITYLGGANDMFVFAAVINANPAAYFNQDGTPTQLTIDTVSNLARSALQDVATLRARQYSKILLGNLPNIGATPFAASQGAAAQQLFAGLSTIFNTALSQGMTALNFGTPASGVVLLDLNAKFTEYLGNPASVGITDPRSAACKQTDGGFQSSPGSIPARKTTSSLFCNRGDLVAPNADRTYLFADGVHPTPKGHELIAEEALRVLRLAQWR